jgi:Tfp pilus assembly protein PilF
MYFFGYEAKPRRAVLQRAEAVEALRLAPELPQAHVAMALVHYWGNLDYERALTELERALSGLPNDADVWFRIGGVQRRAGNWAAVERAYQMASPVYS